MMIDTNSRRSRRALLLGALGGVAAAAAATVAGAQRVLAAGDDDANLQIGHLYADARGQTTLANKANNNDVLWVASNGDLGHGQGTAVTGYSANGIGVHGWSAGDDAAVRAEAGHGIGVYATSASNYAIFANSDSHYAILAQSIASIAISGQTGADDKPAILGRSGPGTGVCGYSGFQGSAPAIPVNTGVYGLANQDTSSVGVRGGSPAGTGAIGSSTSGTGVLGTSTSGVGVRGASASHRGGVFTSPVAQLRLYPATTGSHPAAGLMGDLFLDSTGNLWLCKGGTNWVSVA